MLQKLGYRAILYMKRNSSTILTCIGAAGVIVTAVMAVRETPKAMKRLEDATKEKGEELTKLEMVRIAGPIYIPSIVIGTSTIACIFGANVFTKQSQASLASAYALIDSSYKEYRAKVRELYGEEADRNIMDQIVIEKAKETNIVAQGFDRNYDLSIDDHISEPVLFYENWSKRYFETTIEQVLLAEYHFNRNFVLRGYAFLNELFDFLGLEKTPNGNILGWTIEDDFYWVDFDHHKVKLEDGLECYILDTQFEPSSELMDYGYY